MSLDATQSIQTYEKSELETILLMNDFSNKEEIKELYSIESSKTIINDSLFELISDKEITISPEEEIIFSMGKDSLKYDLKTVIKACPALEAYISQVHTPKAKITINLPQWITKNSLFEYFVYYKKNTLVDSSTLNYYNILRLSDTFENTTMLSNIIKTKIIPTLSYDSALLFLQESYKKIEQNNTNYNWYELFVTTKEFISANIIQYIQNDKQKFSQLHRVLLEEIIENHILMSNDIEVELFDFLMTICHCTNVYDLITHETLLASSDENSESLISDSYCLIQYAIKESLGNLYKELNRKFNKKIDVIFFVSYKACDDIFNFNFKIHTNEKGKLFSFSILCYFEGGNDSKRYISNKTTSNSKGNINILQLNHFKQKKANKLIIHIKMNAILSFTLQYLTLNFNIFCNDSNIIKLPLILLRDILLIARSIINLSNEEILSSITLWLSDEINSNDESLNRLFEIIDWKTIKRAKIYTFIVKDINIIHKTNLYSYFIKELNIEEDIIVGIKKANYNQLVLENIQLKKTLDLINQINPTYNKDVSEIKKTANDQFNYLFSESDKDEAKQYVPQSSKHSNNSIKKNRMRNKAKDINSIYDSINQMQSLEYIERKKTGIDNYQPVKTIEYEINSNKLKKINICESINQDLIHTPTHSKLQLKQKKGTFNNILNTMQSCSVQNYNYKTKETSFVTQKSIQSDKSLSLFEKSNRIKGSGIVKLDKKGDTSYSKPKRLITIKKPKPKIVEYYRNTYTLKE